MFMGTFANRAAKAAGSLSAPVHAPVHTRWTTPDATSKVVAQKSGRMRSIGFYSDPNEVKRRFKRP